MKIRIILILTAALCACNPSSKNQHLQRVYGRTECLDVAQTEKENGIKIGNGKIVFNNDMSFDVTNDSLQYSNIHGVWDVCCYYEYFNIVYTVDGQKPYQTSSSEFYVTINGKVIHFIFGGDCK